MVACLAYPNAGIVGARLVYPDGTLQHVGVIVGLGGVAGHWFCGQPASQPGPMGRLMVRQTLSAVTGACMLISRECRAATGEFDKKTFAIAYKNVDYCLRAGERGFRTVWTPFFATLTTSRLPVAATRHPPTSRASFASKRRCAQNTGLNPMLIGRSIPGMGVVRASPVPRAWSDCRNRGNPKSG
jgi:hypothetical protein